MRLSPLLQVEQSLTRQLAPGSEPSKSVSYAERSKNVLKELTVNSTASWKGVMTRCKDPDGAQVQKQEVIDADDPAVILRACAADMNLLWNDPTVKTLLKKQGLHLEEMAGL
jgi:hypothetical protein